MAFPTTLTRFLADRAGPSPAVIEAEQTVSYAELDDRGRRAAAGLSALGVGPGDRVALWLPNCVEWLVLYFACTRLGAIAVAVNTRFRSSEVTDIVGRSRAKVLAVWPGFKQIDFAGILAEVDQSALAALQAVVVVGGEVGGLAAALPGRTVAHYADIVQQAPYAADLATPEAGCNVFTTSGTTKAPKLVLHRQSVITGHAEAVATRFGWRDAGTVILQAIPFCGVFGFSQAMAAVAAGKPMINMPVFDAGEAVALIRRHAVTNFVCGDEMVARLLEATSDPHPFPGIRWVGFAKFNPALADIVEQADRRGLRLRGLFGMSEVQALYTMQPDQSPDRGLAGGIPVSPEAEIRVRDPETGASLPPGLAGEVGLRGPSIMVGYLDDPAATAAAFADGFFWTGDLGYLRDDGGFVFLSRMGDVMRLGGFLVSPGEIEAHLLRHRAIDGCQVVGVDRRAGTRPVAFVTLRSGAAFDEGALTDYCRRGLAAYKVPVRIVALDTFPSTLSANGVKIQRARLREMAAALDSQTK